MLELKEYKLNRCRCGKSPKLSLKQSVIEVSTVNVKCKCGNGGTIAIPTDTQEAADKACDELTTSWNLQNTHDGIY